ncbi:MAG: right-handed parallel beta-helix repeat-containing protein, partial [Planctomycetota bacterium]
GMSVSYDRVGHELTISVPFAPSKVGSTNHRWIDNDFLGTPIPQNGRAIPGPFQNLKRGINTFRIWDGLPVLSSGQLPGAAD